MSGRSPQSGSLRSALRERAVGRCVELVWPCSPAPAPGNAASGDAFLIAADRWLVLDADEVMVAEAIAAGAIVVEVEGKWCVLELEAGAGAPGLAAVAPITRLLAERNCAATRLFDCPVILARTGTGSGYLFCVHASYAIHLREALGLALDRMRQQGAEESAMTAG